MTTAKTHTDAELLRLCDTLERIASKARAANDQFPGLEKIVTAARESVALRAEVAELRLIAEAHDCLAFPWANHAPSRTQRLAKAEEEVIALRQRLDAWSGEPSYRTMLGQNDALHAQVARLREALTAAERSLAYWAAKPEGQRWLHPAHGYQDPNGTNTALEAIREALSATEPKP